MQTRPLYKQVDDNGRLGGPIPLADGREPVRLQPISRV
jgi:hypothetical protein